MCINVRISKLSFMKYFTLQNVFASTIWDIFVYIYSNLNTKMCTECLQNVTVLNGPFKCAHPWNEIFNHISGNIRVLNVLEK